MRARRIRTIAAIVLTLSVLTVAARGTRRESAAPIVAGGGDPSTALGPVASPIGALGSTFYCTGGTAKSAGDPFDSAVSIANPGSTALTARLTVYPSAQDGDAAGAEAVRALKPVVKEVPLSARARVEIRLGDLQASPFAAAVVEVSGGGVTVDQRLSGSSGVSMSPCASAASDAWFVPTGTTTKDARELLALFNPFPAQAIVDLSFVTSDGFRAPPAVQGYVVPGRHLSVIELESAIGRHEQVSTQVRARSGRLAVGRLQLFDGTDPAHPKAVAGSLGAPAPATVWSFADGLVSDTVKETYTVFNPSNESANVQLEITLDNPATNGVVDPIQLTVPRQSYAQVVMKDQPRVPAGIGHSVVVRALNGVPVVPERVVTAFAPGPRNGYSPALGAPFVARRWVFAEGRADANFAEFLVILNPASQPARVKVTALAQGQLLAIDGLQALEVAAGERLVVDLGAHVNRVDLPLLVEADRGIVTERGLFAASATGISLAVGIPLVEGIDLPPPPTTTTTTTMPVSQPSS